MTLQKRPRVLIADDYPGMVMAFTRLIEADCDVVGGLEDGRALFDTARRLQPDVILLDLNMPGIDTLRACREIADAMPHSRVIVLTALVDSGLERDVLAAGAFAFIDKQVVSDELLPKIAEAAASGSDRDAARG